MVCRVRIEHSLECERTRGIGGLRSLESVAEAHGVNIRKPGGSHVIFDHPSVEWALSVPARRPIKPIYVRKFVQFIEEVRNE